MLNQKKIRWMSRASIYEKHNGKKDLERNEYFFSDFVRSNILRNIVGVTIAYIFMAALYIVYNIEDIFQIIANLQGWVFLRRIILVYVILLIIYTAVGLLLYSYRYISSQERVKKYYRMLKLIEKYTEAEEEKRS